MFYTRYLFKIKRLSFSPPGKVDEEFYTDIKQRLTGDAGLKFESEVLFWPTYKKIFIVFLMFLASALFLFLLFHFGVKQNTFLFALPILILFITVQPTVYFILLMINYYLYLRNERRYQSGFKNAVIHSKDFTSFTTAFYRDRYAETAVVQTYLFENDIDPVKQFVENNGLNLEIAIYKLSSMPHDFIILSAHEDIDRFIERQDGCKEIKKGEKLRWVLKYQVDMPCIYGNKKLKKSIALP
jgi:hypothetical protein